MAEGIINGQVVCRTKKMPSRRSTPNSVLSIDHAGQSLVADGSDFVVVIAEVTDDNGNVRRLAKDNIVFFGRREGSIIGDASIGATPSGGRIGFGPGADPLYNKPPEKIKVKAHVQFEGQMAPTPAEMEFESVSASYPFCGTAVSRQGMENVLQHTAKRSLSAEEINRALQEVEQQQTDFGEKK